MSSYQFSKDDEEILRMVLVFVGVALLSVVLPMIIYGMALGYFFYWSFNEKASDPLFWKFLRIGTIGLLGYQLGVFLFREVVNLLPFAYLKFVKNVTQDHVDVFFFYDQAQFVFVVGSIVTGLITSYALFPRIDIQDKVYLSFRKGFLKFFSPMDFLDPYFLKKKPLEKIFGIAILMTIGAVFLIVIAWILSKSPYAYHPYPIFGSFGWLGVYYILSESRAGRLHMVPLPLLEQQEQAVYLGEFQDSRTPLHLTWKDINHHIHILGQPGSGKSVLLRNIYKHQITHQKGLLLIDLKSDFDIVREFSCYSENSGRMEDLLILDFSHPNQSAKYNPLNTGNPTELKDKIIGSMEWSEPYYKKLAEGFLLSIMNAVVIKRDVLQSPPTLKNLIEFLSDPKALLNLASEIPKNFIEVKSDLMDRSRDLATSDVFKGLSGLRVDLQTLVNSDLGSIFDSNVGIHITEIIQKNKILLISLDGQRYPLQSLRIGRMILSELRAASGTIVSNTTKNNRPNFTVVVDEFADLVSQKEIGRLFAGFLNRCRGSGIGVIVAHQSLGDFEDKQVMSQIVDSTETLFSFVQKDPETCELISSIVGTQETWKETEQTGQQFLMKSNTGNGSRRLVQEYILHPNEIKNLNVGEAIYIAKKPSRFGKVKICFLNSLS